MKIQLWSYNYDPEPTGIGPVSTALAQALHARGHEIEVIAAHPHYPSPDWGMRFLPYRGGHISVLRLPLWVGRATALQRYRQELTFIAALAVASPFLRKCDVSIIVSPSFPALLPAIVTHRVGRSPWILWLQDILPDGAAATGLVSNDGVIVRASRSLESVAYRHATLIVALSQAFRHNLLAKDVPEGKIRVIYDPATREPLEATPRTADSLVAQRPWRLLSMGNIGFSQGLSPLVEAFERSEHLSSGDVCLIATGVGAADVASRVRSERVQMLGLLSDSALESELRRATLALVSQQYSGAEFNIPSELMNFMAYGIPIVAAVNPRSEVARIVEQSGGGWVIDSGDPPSLPAKIAELLEQPEDVAHRGRYARRYAEENFSGGNVRGTVRERVSRRGCWLLAGSRSKRGRCSHPKTPQNTPSR